MPPKAVNPLLHKMRVVMRNGASFTIETTMRRSGPYMLQQDTTTNPTYTGESRGLSVEDERMQNLMSKYEGFGLTEEESAAAAGADVAAAAPGAAKGGGKQPKKKK